MLNKYGVDLILHYRGGASGRFTGRRWAWEFEPHAIVLTNRDESDGIYIQGYPWDRITHFELVPGRPPRRAYVPGR